MPVPQLLLDTLEHLSKDDFNKFKWYLGFNILKNCERIPLCHLESPHRHNTVSKMIESYSEEMAVNVTVAILKKMNHHRAAERLKKTYTEGAAAQEKVSRAVGSSSSSALALPTERRSFTDGAAGAIAPIASNGSMISGNNLGNITGNNSGGAIVLGSNFGLNCSNSVILGSVIISNGQLGGESVNSVLRK